MRLSLLVVMVAPALFTVAGQKLVEVLGGAANYFGLHPSLERIAYVLVTLFTASVSVILLYFAMAFIVRVESKAGSTRQATSQEQAS